MDIKVYKDENVKNKKTVRTFKSVNGYHIVEIWKGGEQKIYVANTKEEAEKYVKR